MNLGYIWFKIWIMLLIIKVIYIYLLCIYYKAMYLVKIFMLSHIYKSFYQYNSFSILHDIGALDKTHKKFYILWSSATHDWSRGIPVYLFSLYCICLISLFSYQLINTTSKNLSRHNTPPVDNEKSINWFYLHSQNFVFSVDDYCCQRH